MKKRKKLVLGLVLALLVLGFGGFFYYKNQAAETEMMVTEIKKIEQQQNDFTEEKDDTKKLAYTKKLIADAESYQKKHARQKKAIQKFKETIKEEQAYFKEQHQKILAENEVADLQTVEQSELEEKVKSLEGLQETIKETQEVVYTKKEAEEIIGEIVDRLDDYNERAEEIAAETMNFSQIEQGDYSSLMGEWEEVAMAVNMYRGDGITWQDTFDDQITITKSEISVSGMTLRGNILLDPEEKAVIYREEDDYLRADTEEGAIIWNIGFYPKGAVYGASIPNQSIAIDQNKERISLRTSNMGLTMVFQRVSPKSAASATSNSTSSDSTTSEAATAESDANKASKMDLAAISTGNYESIIGSWQNGLGETITADKDVLNFSNINSFGAAGTVSGLTIDVPDFNDENGQPQLEEWAGTERKEYDPQLEIKENQEILELTGSFIDSGYHLFFLPEGTRGELTVGDLNQDKIVSLSTQSSIDSIPEEQVYYKVK
ncbi:DUF6287 domain-containing protein [Enterococcus timonensis]|uniref:DUF6287 domain-containing protein n=1 Tax=Enterococcus timonensis TaxID=1852364 RepID=UPI0008DA3141|nr:DUF6287 domain-containing protein [Enterococcus timonensis]